MEEFLTNGVGLGYNDVKTGESFVKIGVGAVRKPDMRIEPGKEFTWRIAYDFYTLPKSGAK